MRRYTPDIGATVWHRHDGEWVRDWVTQVLVVYRGDKPENDVWIPAVLMWGATRTIHKPATDVWSDNRLDS